MEKKPFRFMGMFAPKGNSIPVLSPKKQVEILQAELQAMQIRLDVTVAGFEETLTEGSGAYTCDKAAVKELVCKYEGKSLLGKTQVRNIVDVRSAFIIGQGIKLIENEKPELDEEGVAKKVEKTPGKVSREMEWARQFVEDNNLDEEMPQELAKEAELEGRILLRIIKDEDKECKVRFQFLAWSVYQYVVKSATDNYDDYESVTYKDPTPGKSSEEITLKKGEFVYRKFAGRLSKVNEAMPKVAMVLGPVEDIDRCLNDWRTMNHLFASPTPYFECEKGTDIKTFIKNIEATNWKIGKVFAGSAKFTLVSMTAGAQESLYKEIETKAKIVSGMTGVPVHFLGYPDLMSNRSTSTDLFEFINASVNRERKIWQGFYQELFDVAAVVAGKDLKKGKVKAQILVLTEAQLRLLSEVWLPIYTSGAISLDYFLSKIPDLDPEKEKEIIEEAQTKMLQAVKDKEAEADLHDDEEGVVTE